MRIAVLVPIAILLALAVAGCSSEPSPGSASSRCEPLPEPALGFLETVLPSGMTLDHPVYVQSEDRDDVYFVAASVGGEPALWVMTKPDASGVAWSVNEHAFDVSQIARSPSFTEGDDGASEALSCVGTD